MNNALGNINNLMTQFQSFMQNPAQFLIQRRLPPEVLQNPAGAIQQLLNSGAMSQAQLNQYRQIAGQMQQNPMFAQLLK